MIQVFEFIEMVRRMLNKLNFLQTKTHSKCLVSKTAACYGEKMSGLCNFEVLFIYQTWLKVSHFIIYSVLCTSFPQLLLCFCGSLGLICEKSRIGAIFILQTMELRPTIVILPRKSSFVLELRLEGPALNSWLRCKGEITRFFTILFAGIMSKYKLTIFPTFYTLFLRLQVYRKVARVIIFMYTSS